VRLAYSAQSALGLTLASTLVWLWRSKASYDLKAAALACGCLLATPYLLDYDLVTLALSIAFLVRHGLSRGFLSYEITLLSFCWITPLIARSAADATGVPIGLISMLVVYTLTLRRAVVDLAARESMN